MIEDIRLLVENGFAVHLLKAESKAPVAHDWSKKPVMTWNKLRMAYREGQNVGVRLGEPSKVEGGFLHLFDLDIKVSEKSEEAWTQLKKLFPKVNFKSLPTVQSGSLGESRHLYFISSEAFPSKKIATSGVKFTDSAGKKHWTWEIEVFGTGKQAVLPPSIHPDTGKSYRWLKEPDFLIGIPELDADMIADQVYGAEDDEEELESDALGISYAEAEQYLADLDLDHWCDDREGWRNVGMALHHEFNGSKEGLRIWVAFSKQSRKFELDVCKDQWRSFKTKRKSITMRSIVQASRQGSLQAEIDGLDDDPLPAPRESRSREPEVGSDGIRVNPEDPDLSILWDVGVRSPPFPLDIFGPRIAKEIAAHSINSGAPIDFVAAALLGGTSAMIGNTNRVKVKEGFVQPPILWCQIIGQPSTNKSPGLRVITNVMRQIEARYLPFYLKQLEKWEKDKKRADINMKAWEGKMKAMMAEGKDMGDIVPDANCVAPPEPHERNFILNDLTIEAFMRTQQRTPRGFMVFRDELAGWLGNMERYSSDSERAAWLESYDGGTYSIRRVKDGNTTIQVQNLCAPVLGGIQPERLLDITANSTVDDGLQARFLPFWPEHEVIPMSLDVQDDSYFVDLFQKLSELEMDEGEDGRPRPFIRPFTREALTTYKNWSDRRDKAEAGVRGRVAGAFGKSRGQVARLACVLEFLWWAERPDFDGDDAPPKVISKEAVEAAIRFRESYLVFMQRRVFMHANVSVEMQTARAIASWVVENKIEEFNTTMIRRDAALPGVNTHTRVELIEVAIAILASMGWLVSRSSEKRRGRPSKGFHINPRVWDLV